ncbi:hypothetical protein GEMRC1_010288 [Eukaryota sp. GEM-RC1]
MPCLCLESTIIENSTLYVAGYSSGVVNLWLSSDPLVLKQTPLFSFSVRSPVENIAVNSSLLVISLDDSVLFYRLPDLLNKIEASAFSLPSPPMVSFSSATPSTVSSIHLLESAGRCIISYHHDNLSYSFCLIDLFTYDIVWKSSPMAGVSTTHLLRDLNILIVAVNNGFHLFNLEKLELSDFYLVASTNNPGSKINRFLTLPQSQMIGMVLAGGMTVLDHFHLISQSFLF